MSKRARLTDAITVKFSAEERAGLEARAKAVGLALRTYMRRELLGSNGVSQETGVILAEIRRLWEFSARMWQGVGEGDLVARTLEKVDAIESRGLAAGAKGGK